MPINCFSIGFTSCEKLATKFFRLSRSNKFVFCSATCNFCAKKLKEIAPLRGFIIQELTYDEYSISEVIEELHEISYLQLSGPVGPTWILSRSGMNGPSNPTGPTGPTNEH